MEIADSTQRLVEEEEGFSAVPFLDVAGNPTIGYGHKILPGETFTRLTRAQARKILVRDMSAAADAVDRYVTVPLTAGQRSALVDFTFNVGPEDFETSTLLRLLNEGHTLQAADQLLRWDHYHSPDGVLRVSADLRARRERERRIFLS